MSTGKFARDKGQRAERAVVGLLQPVVNKVWTESGTRVDAPPQLERNLMQCHKGGHDLVGLDWLALEVKHQETFHINDWWEQTKEQAGKHKIPVLIYKKNNVKWRVMMFGYLEAGSNRVRCPVDITVDAFLVWFENRLRHEFNKESQS